MESPPIWYRLVKASQYLGVPPWELAERGMWWLHVAEEAQGAEAHAQAIAEKRQNNRR